MRVGSVLLLFLAACAADSAPPDDDAFEVGKADGMACLPSVESDDARGLLAFANDDSVDVAALRELGIFASPAQNLVDARPFATVVELDAVPGVGNYACRAMRKEACDVRGLCEPPLPLWTWNLKTFPLSGSTIDRVAETLESAELVGFQEVDSLPSFDELIGKLPGWVGMAGEYGFGTRVAIAFRADRLQLVSTEDVFTDDSDHFPRPVLVATFEIHGRVGTSRFSVVDVHLKAQVDADSQRRRSEAIAMLEPWLASRRARGERVIVLGDWNDDIDDAPSSNVFTPLLSKPDAYVTPTVDVAKAGGYSYIPFKRLIDHVIMTREAADTLHVADVGPVALETSISDYLHTVSDHRPVRATLIPILPTE